ncbi:ThiF family adenylyltransferase [Pedobacter vanadiisoli]|uniref:ThiF family adenylyltransferase n=1 Tax=Pedobacter vanadiisoli TaxID=1761975 RepID=A0ABW5MHL5_9SPHI
MKNILRISGEMHAQLRAHLHPGDFKEAIAFALCGRLCTSTHNGLLVHKLLLIPHDLCIRKGDFIEWPTDYIDDLVDEAVEKDMGILKIHSHPDGYDDFSDLDDESDRILFPSIYALMNEEAPHFSAIMYSDGGIKARVVHVDNEFQPVDKVSVVGDQVLIFGTLENGGNVEANLRNMQTFGPGTTNLLKSLTITVIGCSGTGSIVIEQLARLGVGKLVIADPDQIELKNLNRILNSSYSDAINGAEKVAVMQRAISAMGFDTKVIAFGSLLQEDAALIEAAVMSDFIVGAVDSIEGRSILNTISTMYLVPYIDMGVKLVTDKKGGIDEISASVHYLQPGKSSLLSRGVYTLKELAAEGLKRTNPEMYDEQRKNGYVVDVNVESPAVIPINMQTASLAVLEFLARLHPYRYDPNARFAQTNISISDWEIWHEVEGPDDPYLKKLVGRGNMKPMLNSPNLNELW